MTRRLEGRDGSIYRAWIMGTTQEELAERHGIHQTRVSQIIRAVQAAIPPEDVAERRQRVLDVLNVVGQEMAAIMDTPPAQAYSNGRPMENPDGSPILDYSTRMAAADRLVKLTERQSKLLGLDAAQQVDVHVSEQAKQAAASAAADALAFLHEEPEATPE